MKKKIFISSEKVLQKFNESFRKDFTYDDIKIHINTGLQASEGVQIESSSSLFMGKCWKPQLNFEYEKNPDFHQTNAQKIQSHTQTPENYLNF